MLSSRFMEEVSARPRTFLPVGGFGEIGLCRRDAPRGPWRRPQSPPYDRHTRAPCVLATDHTDAPRRRAAFRQTLLGLGRAAAVAAAAVPRVGELGLGSEDLVLQPLPGRLARERIEEHADC